MTAPVRDISRARRLLAQSYVLTNVGVFVLSRPSAVAWKLDQFIGALFLLAALASVRASDDDTRRHGIDLGGIFPGRAGDDRALVRAVIQGVPPALRELGVAALLSLAIMPAFALGWPYFNHAPPARSFALTPDKWQEIATQLFAVALTEEMYFRGFIQTTLKDALGIPDEAVAQTRPLLERLRVMALPILITSVLFAATHVTVKVTLERAVVFFPSLLFGVLRVWRGGIGAAVFFHAISNLFAQYLEGR